MRSTTTGIDPQTWMMMMIKGKGKGKAEHLCSALHGIETTLKRSAMMMMMRTTTTISHAMQ